ncbi:MAG: site-specific DNA-methyltransferase [Spirochaetales bacterium]|nr:site-specific DNA-methyltransferase [Spirochaetales bacterium]
MINDMLIGIAANGEYELVYSGKLSKENIINTTPPALLKKIEEFHGENTFDDSWANMLIHGDNLSVLKTIYDDQQNRDRLMTKNRITLIYIDPPFATKKEFKQQNQKAYKDTMTGAAFLEFLRIRLILLKEILADNGSIYLHIDWRFGHYIKIIMDEVFGPENFLNECIWYYSSGGRPETYYARKHAALYFYKKGKKAVFHQHEIGLPWGRQKRNNMKRNVDPDGRVYWSINSGNKEYTYYEDTRLTPDDVWDDISHLQQKDPERGSSGHYPTQKPEKLLERIIRASSGKGDIVLDAFAGSGTTLAVAEKLKRRWIGIDTGEPAIAAIRKRLLSLSTTIGTLKRDTRTDFERVDDFKAHSQSTSRGLFFIYEKVRKGDFILNDEFFIELAHFIDRHLKGDNEETFSLIYPEGKLKVKNLSVRPEADLKAGEKSIAIGRIKFLLSEIRKKQEYTKPHDLYAKTFSIYRAMPADKK